MSETTLEARGTTYRLATLRGPEMAPLVPLFRRTYGRRFFTADWLVRKYACEYEGVAGFACVASTEEGEIAASLGVLPWPVRFGDRVELAGQLVDAATAADHRRRGLFRELEEMVRTTSKATGISFLYAFPHEEGDSYPGFVRTLGYQHIDDLVEYRQPLRALAAERLVRRVEPFAGLYDRYVGRALRRHEPRDGALPNSLCRDGFAGIDRDATFHAYKSGFGGSRVVELDGGRVWLKVSGGLLIGDVEASSDADLERTFRALEQLGARLGVHRILFQASRETRFSAFLGSRFRTLRGLAVVYRNLRSEIPAERLRFTFGDLDNF